jgi:hypothetical protein
LACIETDKGFSSVKRREKSTWPIVTTRGAKGAKGQALIEIGQAPANASWNFIVKSEA